MKRFFNIATIALAALSIAAGCQKEEPVDPYTINFVYVFAPSLNDFSLQYYPNGEFKSSIPENQVLVPVRCTKPAPADMTVTFEADPSLVEKYNQENGTQCSLLEKAVIGNSSLVIRKGEYISADSLKVTYDLLEFQDGKGEYLLPLVITSVKGAETTLSERSVIYLHYTSTELFANVAAAPAGTLVSDTSGWKLEFGGSDCTGTLLTDNTSTINWKPWEDGNGIIDIDFGSELNLKTIAVKWYMYYYSATDVTLYSSEDGQTYKSMGSYYLNEISSTSQIKYLELFEAMKIRYMRLEFMGDYMPTSNYYYPRLRYLSMYTED